MGLYRARETWRNNLIWWARLQLLKVAQWLDDQIEYEKQEPSGLNYVCTYSFYDAKTGRSTPEDPIPIQRKDS